jgi:hypothetical protein
MRNLGVALVVTALCGVAAADRPIPEIYVTIASSSETVAEVDSATRQLDADMLRRAMETQVARTPQLTTVDASGLAGRQLDLSITRLSVTTKANTVEITAELRLAISDRRGEILSMVSGGATVSVPLHAFRASQLPRLRRQALEDAADGMFRPLCAQLLRGVRQSS